jgi:hypothetical protein
LRYRPWALDFTPDDAGFPPFPFREIVNPYGYEPFLEWTTGDWDPALRFWTLPYDPQLTQWLGSVDPSKPSIMAAREFGGSGNCKKWQDPERHGWLEENDLAWRPDPKKPDWDNEKQRAWGAVRAEITQLQMLMQDDRERYLGEIDVQADGLADYVIAFIGADQTRHPWTIELLNCGLAIGNIAYFYYKQQYKRVRPSFLCPGLIPPFGPPAHPAFPSGHSMLGHLLALLLLEIPALQQRYGVFTKQDGRPGEAPGQTTLAGTGETHSPLLWLSQRLAKGRERLGVHYPSDSTGSRHLASGIWWALLHEQDKDKKIDCPTLRTVLRHAIAEWPTHWPASNAP